MASGTACRASRPAHRVSKRIVCLENGPPNLPAPRDDGACDHLVGLDVPSLSLPATTGGEVRLGETPTRWTIIYLEGRHIVHVAYPVFPSNADTPAFWPGSARACEDLHRGLNEANM